MIPWWLLLCNRSEGKLPGSSCRSSSPQCPWEWCHPGSAPRAARPALQGTEPGPRLPHTPGVVQTPCLGHDAPRLAATIQPVPHRTQAQGAQHGQNQKVYLLFFFSRFLKVHQVHHSFLSCLCSLKHNRPLTSAVPHNVTIMNKWQINDSREKTHLSHRKEILFLQSNSSPEMLIK